MSTNKKAIIKQIFIIGEINHEINKEIVTDLFNTDWKDEKYNELVIYISTCGGLLSDCFSMIDSIELLKATYKFKITTVVLGEASSAGFFLFLLGDTRIVLPNGRMFIHEHITFTDGQTYSEFKKEEASNTILYTTYIDYVSKRLKISPNKVKTLIAKNAWLTRDEMIEWKIIKD